MLGRGDVTVFKALGTRTNRKLGLVRLTIKVENREKDTAWEGSICSFQYLLFWNRRVWNIVCPSWFLRQNSWKGDWETSLLVSCTSSFSFSSAPVCCLPIFFLIFLFIYILFYFSRVLAVTDVLITISIGFWVHFCNHIFFYLFVLPGMLLLAHVFSFLALRMFLSNSKIFFQSSLPFSVFDVILFISFPLVQCMINQFYINREITKISCWNEADTHCCWVSVYELFSGYFTLEFPLCQLNILSHNL